MIITPENEAYLLKSPLSVDELHQLDFANETAQVNYFQSLPKLALMRITYQRENGTLVVPFNIEQIRTYNYVMYKNSNYGNKWFYAFITGMTYEGNTVTSVALKTDVFQTYLFDFTWKRSYIKRETVPDDTFGKHLLPESLDYGDYVMRKDNVIEYEICTSQLEQTVTSNTPLIVVQCSDTVGELYEQDSKSSTRLDDLHINGSIPDGTFNYFFYNTISDYVNFIKFRLHLDAIGKGDVINNMYLIPQKVISRKQAYLFMYDANGNVMNESVAVGTISTNTYGMYSVQRVTVTRPTSIGSYTPVNNKVLTYPYNYFLVTNHHGEDLDFHYEDFESSPTQPTFLIEGNFSAICSYVARPVNSKKSYTPTDATQKINAECIRGASLPTLAWSSDYYLNWLAQNGRRQIMARDESTLNAFLGAFETGATAYTANPEGGSLMPVAGAGLDFVGNVRRHVNMMENMKEDRRVASNVPASLKGNETLGDLAFSSNSNGFGFYNYHIREDIAQKIDRFFSMYGYRVNELKIPNTKCRSEWNYIQTVGANIVGDIPEEALSEIKSLFNNGLTIWHNPDHFLNYDLTNSIV